MIDLSVFSLYGPVVQDIGQLDNNELKTLARAVRLGLATKTREHWHGWGSIPAGPLKNTWSLTV